MSQQVVIVVDSRDDIIILLFMRYLGWDQAIALSCLRSCACGYSAATAGSICGIFWIS